MFENVQKFVRKRKKVNNFIYARGKKVDNYNNCYFLFIFIRPSYTNIRTPRRASNGGDLPPGVGALTRPL